MKTSFTQQEIKVTFCTVSSSLLLCSSMEVQASPAEEETTPWYRQDVPVLTLPALATTYPGRFSPMPDMRSSHLTTEDAAPCCLGSTLRPGLAPGTNRCPGPRLFHLRPRRTQRPGAPDPAKRQWPYPAGRPDRRHQPDPGQQQRLVDQSRPIRPEQRHPQPARPKPRRLLEPDRPTRLARRFVGQWWPGQRLSAATNKAPGKPPKAAR